MAAGHASRDDLLAEQCFEIPATSNYAINHHIVAVRSIQDERLADRTRAHARPKIITATTGARMRSEQGKSPRYRLNQAICDFKAAALEKDVVGDFFKIRFSVRCEAMPPQRGVAERPAAIRRRRRLKSRPGTGS